MKICQYEYYNAECLSCGAIHKIMIKVGPLVFCKKHCKEIFPDGKIDSDSEAFLFWRKKYFDKIEEECK